MTSRLIGQQIEHYLIESVIGEGGMGTVYQAEDVNLARPVAMKVMHPQFAAQPQFQQRFQQEAQTIARLSHPSIVTVYHFGREQGELYIVMEMVPGLSLGAYIRQLAERQQVVRLDETILLIAQAASALGYAHRKGVIHRDVKPDNIIVKMVDEAEQPHEPPLRAVVTDFGLAKLLEGGLQTQSGEFMGTLAYVSPEQVMDMPLDGRSDIYSLGIVLYQLATGQLPFDIRTPSDAVLKHINDEPPAPHEVQPGLPLPVEKIILKALAKRPDDRFQTGDELAQALRQAAAGLSDQDVTLFTAAAAGSSVVSIVTDILDSGIWEGSAGPMVDEMTQVRGRDRLFITQEGRPPEVFSLYKRSFTIGRSQECDIVLTGKRISRQHTQFERTRGFWQLEDLGSTNGTTLNNRKLTPGEPVSWHNGELAHIGDVSLQLETAVRKYHDDPKPLAVTPPPAVVPAAALPVGEQISADMRPTSLDAAGICRVLLLNKGQTPLQITVTGSDPQGAIQFDESIKRVTIAAGQKGLVDFYVEPRKRPLLGRKHRLPFTMQINTQQQQGPTLEGQVVALPRVSLWLLALLTFMLLACLISAFIVSGNIG